MPENERNYTMSKVRVIYSTDPNIEDEFYLSDTLLSLKAKGLIAMMLAYPKPDSFKIEEFALFVKDSEDSIRSTMQELEKLGYLDRWQGRNSLGQMLPVEYVIFLNRYEEEYECDDYEFDQDKFDEIYAALNQDTVELFSKVIKVFLDELFPDTKTPS